jgi:hypothetical protein
MTDFDGNFSLPIKNSNDTLIASYLSYKTKQIPLKEFNFNEKTIIVLDEKPHSLQEVVIKAGDPISEQFAVTKMNILRDVYLNPASQGDPLKAITLLPVSTTTNETANPSLRGSSADRSRVMLNGVQIYNPVRASNLNNQGFFSLFNPEIIDNMYVYATNPPLSFGNTSAGLVEIQTKHNLERNELQLSTTLASTGFFLSQKIKKDFSFIQVYSNLQFSDAYVGIQKSKLPTVRNFYTTDAGLNFHTKIGRKGELNLFNYYIDESFKGYGQSFTYQGNVTTDNQRLFTVTNFKYYFQRGVLRVNNGINNSMRKFEFGNLNSKQNDKQIYTSIDYKWHFTDNMKLQFGISHDYHHHKFEDHIPLFYYALSPSSKTRFSETSIDNHILEASLFTNWDINDAFTLSSGIRSNIPINNQQYYLSSQLGLKYRINNTQWLLLSGGKYHNYSIPNLNDKNYNLSSSHQIALDYSYQLKNTSIKAATYFKNESGSQAITQFLSAEKASTYGIEFYVEHNFYKHFKVSFSNAYIDQKITIYGENYPGSNDYNYLIRSSFQYTNPKIFTLSLLYISRPGTFYNDITNGVLDNQTNLYRPVFSETLYDVQYKSYNRIDLSISKYIPLKKSNLIGFLTLNNLLDTQNQKEPVYNTDYSSKSFEFYQLRGLYFGLVWQIIDL